MAKILLIDDEQQVLEFLSAVMQKKGHLVSTAENGREGLECLARERFDLVITDLFMDTQDGLSTIMQMRNDYAETPIIAISGGSWSSGTDFLAVAKKMGVAFTFIKPIAISEFFEAIDSLTAATDE